MGKTRYMQLGTGGRGMMFTDAIATVEFRGRAELVGLCDSNAGRLKLRLGWALAPGFDAADFDRMIVERRPDVVIVTTADQFHDH